MKSPKVVAITGPAAAGKSTLARALQSELSGRGSLWLCVEIDAFAECLARDWRSFDGTGGPFADRGFAYERDDNHGIRLNLGADGRRVLRAFHQSVAAIANSGVNVVCETVVYDDQDWADWSDALKAVSVYWVKLTAPLPILEAREQNRPVDIQGLARGMMARTPVGQYDLEIDTASENIREVVDHILNVVR